MDSRIRALFLIVFLITLDGSSSEVFGSPLGTLPVSQGNLPPAARELLEGRVVFESVALRNLCSFDRVALSPSARYFVAWYSSAERPATTKFTDVGRAVLGATSCLTRDAGSNCNLVRFNALSPFSVPQWTKDETRLYIVHQPKGLFQFAVAGPGEVSADTKPPVPVNSSILLDRPYTLQVRGATSESGQDRAALYARYGDAISKLTDRYYVHSLTFDGRGHVGATLVDKTTLDLVFMTPSALASSGAKSVHLADARVWSTADGTIVDGLGYTAWLGPSGHGPVDLSFSRPIFESGTGQVIGVYGDRSAQFFAPTEDADRAGKFIAEILSQYPGDFIRAVSVSYQAHATLIDLGNAFGETTVAVDRGDREPQSYVCPSERPSANAYALAIENIGSTSWPVWAHYYRQKNAPLGLVVFFHGGPESAAYADHYAATISRYLGFGYDVLVPEYSGSFGAGLETSQRLARLGPLAIEKDIRAIADYLHSSSPRTYRLRVFHGESFGAVYFLAEQAQLGNLFDKFVLLAPYLRHRDPAEWTKSWPLGGYSPDFQYLDEKYSMGIDRPNKGTLVRWMERRIKQLQIKHPTLAIFAASDVVSKPQDLPTAQTNPLLVVKTSPNSFHELLPSFPQTWDLIGPFLAASMPGTQNGRPRP